MKAIFEGLMEERDGFRIRPMTEEDLEEVSRLESLYFSDPWSKNSYAESLQNEDALFLCIFEGDELLGYCGVYNACGDGDICDVAVKESHRGRGIGRRMLEVLMDLGRRMGIQNYTLEVRVSNAGAIALYKKLGFESAGIRPGFYEKPKEDALIMWKYS